ncbi:Uu.00g091930.m01.CDS01 [Anthostomella pinea]|uniref:Uu.00g091930.m01.CDS01 n=1 Tax=Anthostomella pinea TaxID=933095 RepID=A0AAI8VNV4_9PEZI|nr:Uu.00g091930.m01.CDS01 [Anthostomella pinea]
MAHLPPPNHRPGTTNSSRGAAAPGTTAAAATARGGNTNNNNNTAAGGGGDGGVRRNLFQSHLKRRPTPTTSSSNSAETLRLDVDVLSDTSEIVIRDNNGDFDVGDPPMPPLDDPDEVALDDAQENERERQKLAEAVRHHQINHTRTPAQPEEVLEVLRASMRAKVAALGEDNWMYEPEEQSLAQ